MLNHGVMVTLVQVFQTPQPRIKIIWCLWSRFIKTTLTFVSQYAYDHGIKEEIGLNKIVLPVKNTRNLTKRDMKLNDYAQNNCIDPQTLMSIDDELVTVSNPYDIIVSTLFLVLS